MLEEVERELVREQRRVGADPGAAAGDVGFRLDEEGAAESLERLVRARSVAQELRVELALGVAQRPACSTPSATTRGNPAARIEDATRAIGSAESRRNVCGKDAAPPLRSAATTTGSPSPQRAGAARTASQPASPRASSA